MTTTNKTIIATRLTMAAASAGDMQQRLEEDVAGSSGGILREGRTSPEANEGGRAVEGVGEGGATEGGVKLASKTAGGEAGRIEMTSWAAGETLQ